MIAPHHGETRVYFPTILRHFTYPSICSWSFWITRPLAFHTPMLYSSSYPLTSSLTFLYFQSVLAWRWTVSFATPFLAFRSKSISLGSTETLKVLHAQMDDFSNMKAREKESTCKPGSDGFRHVVRIPDGVEYEGQDTHAFSCVRQTESVTGVRRRRQGGAGGRSRLEIVLGRGSDLLTQNLL